jgi:POT family proton-dependent oligopeptide transporter
MWERFSFYGMRALLVLYIIKDYMVSVENNEEIAYGIYAAYGALVYATPLLGGFIADRFIGYRKAIMLGGILMAVGHFFMAFPTDFFFYGALGFLIAGNGFFKPNISSLVGSLYKEGDVKRDSGFTIFYMGINLGAAVAPLLCGYIGFEWGWHYGFGLAGIGMLAGVVVFWDGMKKGVFGDKGLQPNEYKEKKFFNFNINTLVWVFGCLIVPIFAYLIVLEAGGNHFLGSIINVLLLISVGYAGYLMYENYKIGQPAASKK